MTRNTVTNRETRRTGKFQKSVGIRRFGKPEPTLYLTDPERPSTTRYLVGDGVQRQDVPCEER